MSDQKANKEESVFGVFQLRKENTNEVLQFLNTYRIETGLPKHFKRVREMADYNDVLFCCNSENFASFKIIMNGVIDYLFSRQIFYFKIKKIALKTKPPATEEEFHLLNKQWPLTWIRDRKSKKEQRRDLVLIELAELEIKKLDIDKHKDFVLLFNEEKELVRWTVSEEKNDNSCLCLDTIDLYRFDQLFDKNSHSDLSDHSLIIKEQPAPLTNFILDKIGINMIILDSNYNTSRRDKKKSSCCTDRAKSYDKQIY